MTAIDRAPRHNRVLEVIAVFRLAKAVLLALAGVATLRLLNPRIASAALAWLDALPYAVEHRVSREIVAKLLSASSTRKEIAAAIAFAYAALFATEGIGLWLEKLWAEWLTIAATASFIPFELYEVAQRTSVLRVAVLLANVFIVGYLIRQVRAYRTAKAG
jgi:uncharacterized membrane protein (DUF2068 family)